MTDFETKVGEQYQNLWSNPKKIHRDKNLFLGWHFGYYEKGIKTQKEAFINMNNYIAKLLNLNKDKNLKILDAGCGVGATLTYFAKKYPTSAFYGITLTSNEIRLAEKLKKKNNLKNVNFFQQSYNNTDFPSEYFDGVYSLESVAYAENKQFYIKEMNRIIKKNGKLVVNDIFRKNDYTNLAIKNIRHKILKIKDYDKPNYTLNMFKKCLSGGGFEDIEIHNLSKNGNIKYFFLYGFIIKYIFYSSRDEFVMEFKQKKKSRLHLICKFLSNFISKILILINSKPDYYSITAMKKSL